MLRRLSIAGTVVYLLVFILMYAPQVAFIPRPDARGIVGGFLDGVFMLPILLFEAVSQYIHHYTGVPAMFRVPNHGISYNFGYVIGAVVLWNRAVLVVQMPARRLVRRRRTM